MAGKSGMDEVGRRKSTSASGRRAVCETVCVPAGIGFPEFHSTSDSHASGSARTMALAPRASRGAAPAAAREGGGASGGKLGSGIVCSVGDADLRLLRLDRGPNIHPARFRGGRVAGQIGMAGLQSGMHGILAQLSLGKSELAGDRVDALFDLLDFTAKLDESPARLGVAFRSGRRGVGLL